jgi:plastocyanin
MNELDSRSLAFTDCFAQRFEKPGEVTYEVVHAAGAMVDLKERPFRITVAAAGGEGPESEQHDVVVRWDGRAFAVEPAALKIAAGEVVLWHAPDAKAPGFLVRGEGPDGAFSSAALAQQAVYTHAFGLAGDYRWVDANGSRIGGQVRVREVDGKDKRAMNSWANAIAKPTLVTISGDRVEPEQVRIYVGQTVFFAVEKAPGITITDARVAKR